MFEDYGSLTIVFTLFLASGVCTVVFIIIDVFNTFRKGSPNDDSVEDGKNKKLKNELGSREGRINSTMRKRNHISGNPDITDSSRESAKQPHISTEQKLEAWQNQKINLACVGRSNTGKSTFINLMRDVKEGDHGFAKTGSGNTTMEVHEYKHPHIDTLSMWDVPGFGTAIFTKKKFLEEVNLLSFDFCFIFIDSVFMEDDIWLANRLQGLKIPFCFVRSKVDTLFKPGLNRNRVIEENRNKLFQERKQLCKVIDSELFLISNLKEYFYLGDIQKLFDYMINVLPGEQVEVLLFFLPIISPTMIERKYHTFKRRIEMVSMVAGAISAVPIPLIDIPTNFKLMTKEIKLYIEGFGLDKDYVKDVPGVKQRSTSGIVLQSCMHGGGRALALIGTIAVSQIDCVVPLYGSFFTAAQTKKYVTQFLTVTLDELKSDAERVYKFYTKGK